MTPKITCNERPGRLFTKQELSIMHENYKELIQLLYLIAERKGDTATLRMMEDIFIGDATYP